ncbi:MAG: helix-turn-helix domain-containing protein [Actinomycetota bacterium]
MSDATDVPGSDSELSAGYGQFCPIAVSLDVLGDQWTILLMRDMLWSGALRFNELVDRNPGLSESVLTDRLRTLEHHGLAEQLDEPKRRWILTEQGKGIEGLVTALFEFGIPLVATATVNDNMLSYAVSDSARRRRLDLLDVAQLVSVEVRVGDGRANVEIAPGSIRVSEQQAPSATVTMGPTALAELMAGQADFAHHRANGAIGVEGDLVAAEQVVNFFTPVGGMKRSV